MLQFCDYFVWYICSTSAMVLGYFNGFKLVESLFQCWWCRDQWVGTFFTIFVSGNAWQNDRWHVWSMHGWQFLWKWGFGKVAATQSCVNTKINLLMHTNYAMGYGYIWNGQVFTKFAHFPEIWRKLEHKVRISSPQKKHNVIINTFKVLAVDGGLICVINFTVLGCWFLSLHISITWVPF